MYIWESVNAINSLHKRLSQAIAITIHSLFHWHSTKWTLYKQKSTLQYSVIYIFHSLYSLFSVFITAKHGTMHQYWNKIVFFHILSHIFVTWPLFRTSNLSSQHSFVICLLFVKFDHLFLICFGVDCPLLPSHLMNCWKYSLLTLGAIMFYQTNLAMKFIPAFTSEIGS